MFTGLTRFLSNGFRFFRGQTSTTYVGIRGPQSADPATSFYLELFSSLPTSGTKLLTVNSTGQIGHVDQVEAGGSGTVTSVGLTAPNIFTVSNSPVTTNGNLTLSLANQTANTVFAGPTTGAAAAPSFRSLVWADVSALAGTSASSFAVGNDSRLHTPNTDFGTTASSFQLDYMSAGVRLKNSSGTLQVRNGSDSAFADIEVQNLIVRGTTTTIHSETLTIADNIIVLNRDVTGTPSENAGIQVERGTSTDATFLWDEVNDRWMAGLAGSEIPLARVFRQSFTNASLTAGVLTVTHNLGQQYVRTTIVDNNNREVMPDEVTFTSGTALAVDLTSFDTLSGTWNIVVVG